MLSTGLPMILGNIRAKGIRTLAAWCLGRGCNHHRVLDVDTYPDDVLVPSFGPRLRCEHCGHGGAPSPQLQKNGLTMRCAE
jgi:hypothetical protein